MEKYKLNTIEEAIEDFREGRFLIVVDDEDRENEGDFILAAEKITPEKVNFMLTHGRGVLCAPVTEARCEELELNMQVVHNTSVLETPFTVTVDKWQRMYDRRFYLRPCADDPCACRSGNQTFRSRPAGTYQSPTGAFAWRNPSCRAYRGDNRYGTACRTLSGRRID